MPVLEKSRRTRRLLDRPLKNYDVSDHDFSRLVGTEVNKAKE